ncbi:conserved hypothetical protein [Candida tropicalis MYA-3404]|uniref:Acyl-coenzyme A diphosphatase SCS3 n=1 Tax=Candida tropicalis (strain ATCC MYA-3404 / T1) TaxID=294747 RepID=C5MI48_CANTT|nr:conserved hypothetical protein [Candida tropicalis MYA-3404]EER30745.1 conserved hypothetical protein [Candida tropicalis MYA-3404]KAG4409185.1 hypothetical protein JTP64_002491 [Candida tropicalis]
MSVVYDQHYKKIMGVFKTIETKLKLKPGEFIFVLSFILNFLIGRIIHFTSPEEEIYNYYSNKKNIFNKLFVKQGWGWTTLVILIFYSNLIYKTSNYSIRQKLIYKGILNYLLSTLWWILFTQWCFGLPIMDKIFIWTGGKCKIEGIEIKNINHLHNSFIQTLENIWESTGITSYTCRKFKGNWIGGHDPSGHVFLMIHSSLYLYLETIDYFPGFSNIKNNLKRLVRVNSFKEKLIILWNTPSIFISLLIGLWWFMLLITNMYFHSILEKLVGLIFGYLGIAVIYYLPRWR